MCSLETKTVCIGLSARNGGLLNAMDVQPILVVEDETLIRIDLIDILERGGYTVDEAVNGGAGVAKIERRDELCGLITDINLGSGTNGWEVARHARKKFGGVAVVYITGDSAADWPSEGVPNSLVLQKPFAEAQVLNAISTLLNQTALQSGLA